MEAVLFNIVTNFFNWVQLISESEEHDTFGKPYAV